MRGHDLRITLRSGDPGSLVAVAEHTRPGSPDPDDPHALFDALPVGQSTVQLEHLPAIRLLEQWLRRWEWIAQAATHGRRRDLLVPGTFEVLGDLLWQVAFAGQVGDALHRIREEAKNERASDKGSMLRVRLGFGPGAEDLATLPWEFLRSPKIKFLAQDPFVVFGRFFDGSEEREVRLAADQVMRALVIVALPEGQGYAAERAEILGLVTQMNKMKGITVDCIPRWDTKKIRDTLQAQNDGAPNLDVIHLVAVCSDRESAKPKLLMPNESGEPEFFDPDPTVQELTSLLVVPSLVVLHLSEGDTDPSAHFEQLAPGFIDAGVPCVLAMQYPMPPEKGREFVTNFYSGLANGEQVGSAIHTARRQLRDVQSNRQFGTPVLYLQSRADGILLQGPGGIEADLEPLVTGPAPLVHTTRSEAPTEVVAPDAVSHLGQRVGAMLLRQLQRVPNHSKELEIWLSARAELWPDDLDAISASLRGLQRAHDDDPAYVQQVAALQDVVRRVRAGASHG